MAAYQWWWQGVGFMWIFPLLFLLVMAVFAFRGAGCMGLHHRRRPPQETPREILDRRFASGEISPQQYEDARRTLAG